METEANIPFRGSSLFLLIFVGHLLGCTFTYMLNYESDLNWMVRRCLRKQGPRVDDKSGITLSVGMLTQGLPSVSLARAAVRFFRTSSARLAEALDCYWPV